ncbi:unnamed protein product [Echinostoma caproni]|uniref:Uncharacterized protein n=1 Tax=Echinostoma caproni TaxID=27848 RepID=A0A3P8I5Q0_9TREM|nr:unnamed protein product [Echinostoma caproni]
MLDPGQSRQEACPEVGVTQGLETTSEYQAAKLVPAQLAKLEPGTGAIDDIRVLDKVISLLFDNLSLRMPPAVTHVIFDVDGLLLDTEVVYTAASTEVLDKYGLKLTYAVKRKLMGSKPTEAARILVNELSAPFTPEEWHIKVHEKLTPERWHQVACLPGAERLVMHLAKHGIPMAAATGCASKELGEKMKNHQNIWKKLDHAVASGDDPEVAHGKPKPDIFLIAAQRFTSPPKSMETVLVFEDSPLGVEAAVKAGMQVVWVSQPEEPPGDAPETIAPADRHRVTRYQSLLDFEPQRFGLPAF